MDNNKNVAMIYCLYEDDLENEKVGMCSKKEEILKKFCEDNNFIISDIARVQKEDSLITKAYNFLYRISNLFTYEEPNYFDVVIDTIILYDIYDLCDDEESFNVFYKFLKDLNVQLITYRQGTIDENFFKENKSNRTPFEEIDKELKEDNSINISFDRCVAIYLKYDECDYDQLKEKEKILIDYCVKNDYKIVKRFYDYQNDKYCLTTPMRKLLNETFPCDYSKLIVIDLGEIATNVEYLQAINTLINDGEAQIITINNGIVGEDIIINSSCKGNVLNKKELKHPLYEYVGSGFDMIEMPF